MDGYVERIVRGLPDFESSVGGFTVSVYGLIGIEIFLE